MRTFYVFIALILFLIGDELANPPIFDLMGATLEELNSNSGSVGLIKSINEQDSISVYQTKIGYQSFIIHKHRVVQINTESYWESARDVKKALNIALDFYKSNGFKITSKSKNSVTVTNAKYKVELVTSYSGGKYQLDDTIKNIIKEK